MKNIDRIKQIDARLEELKTYAEEIDRLRIERKILQDKWDDENLTFEEKVKRYFESTDLGLEIDDLGECRNYPNLYKYIKNQDLNRYQTIHLRDWLYDDMAFIYDKNYKYPKWLTEERQLTYIELAKELIEFNIESVTIDW